IGIVSGHRSGHQPGESAESGWPKRKPARKNISGQDSGGAEDRQAGRRPALLPHGEAEAEEPGNPLRPAGGPDYIAVQMTMGKLKLTPRGTCFSLSFGS